MFNAENEVKELTYSLPYLIYLSIGGYQLPSRSILTRESPLTSSTNSCLLSVPAKIGMLSNTSAKSSKSYSYFVHFLPSLNTCCTRAERARRTASHTPRK